MQTRSNDSFMVRPESGPLARHAPSCSCNTCNNVEVSFLSGSVRHTRRPMETEQWWLDAWRFSERLSIKRSATVLGFHWSAHSAFGREKFPERRPSSWRRNAGWEVLLDTLRNLRRHSMRKNSILSVLSPLRRARLAGFADKVLFTFKF